MAKRNTSDEKFDPIKYVLAGGDGAALDAQLDDVRNYNTVKINGVPKQVRRTLQLQTVADSDLYVATVNAAAGIPGAVDTGTLASGYLARAVRAPLLSVYLGLDAASVERYENDRADRITTAKADRMRQVAADRGISMADLQKTVSVFESMRGNDAVMKALQASDPATYALIMEFDAES